jgi:arabinan endo-1,5-alpha-L-arabinosidase
MTNMSFDPLKPGEGWQDQGLVLMSREGNDFNAIDPFRVDSSDGRAYLAFGSFWSGIKLSELNPETGKPIRRDAPRIALASRNGGAIEAASILERASQFYLFCELRPVLQRRRLDLQHSRRARRSDRGTIPRQRRQSDAGGWRLSRAVDNGSLHWPGRAGGGENLQG